MNMDLEALRELFKDNRTWVSIGEVKQKDYAKDKSVLRTLVKIFPDGEEKVCRVMRTFLGYNKILEGDLVLVIFPDADEELGVVIGQFSSQQDPLPDNAAQDHLVLKAEEGQKAYLESDTKISLTKDGSSDPTEPIVLGGVLKQLLSDVLGQLKDLSDAVAKHTHIGNLGGATTAPIAPELTVFTESKTLFENKKGNPVDNNGINSELSFTEK